MTINSLDEEAGSLGAIIAKGGQVSLAFDSNEASPNGAEFLFVRNAFTIEFEGLCHPSFETDRRAQSCVSTGLPI